VPADPIARRLHERPRGTRFLPVHANRFFKVFRIPDAAGADAGRQATPVIE
jgi:hypothetical protein